MFTGLFGGDEVVVGKLSDGVPDLIVDRARLLTALDVNKRDVHVRGRDGGGKRLMAICDGDHDVGSITVEISGQVVRKHGDVLHHGHSGAIAPRVPPCDVIKLKVGMGLYRLKGGLETRIAGAGREDDGNSTDGYRALDVRLFQG